MPLGKGRDRPRTAQKVNTLFTFSAARRYASAMLFLAAAAILASPPPEPGFSPAAATAHARASVRIVHAVVVRLGEGALRGEAPPARLTTAHPDGEPQTAKLIEFE